jgi:hypothetical protein
VPDRGDAVGHVVQRLDALDGLAVVDDGELEARRAGVDDEDAVQRAVGTVGGVMCSSSHPAARRQCDIVPFTSPTLSRPTWPRSTSAKACETNG